MPLVSMDRIRVNGGTQCRATVRDEVLDEYFDALENGAKFPAVDLFYDGADYWMADGFTRYYSHVRFESREIDANVHSGGRRDALLFAAGANSEHGMKRTNEDKRRAVELILADPEWSQRSDVWIAEKCRVSDHLVASVRVSNSRNTGQNGSQDEKHEENDTGESSNGTSGGTRRKGRDGRAYKPKKPRKPKAEKPKDEEKPKPKNGSVQFDDEPYRDLFGKLVRFMDARGAAFGKESEHQDIMCALECVDTIYKRWRKRT